MSSIERFGYTSREAGFLGLVAPVSGYFVRAHFNEYLDRECGALAQRFVEKAMRVGHVRALRLAQNRVVYHAYSVSLYAAVGDLESRNRREHRPETIRRRLMALDFCLSQRSGRVIPTRSEKLSLFSALAAAPKGVSKDEPKHEGGRLFQDGQPITLLPDGTPEFAFVDPGFRTFSHWELYLREHRLLLQRSEKALMVYASDPRSCVGAERVFRRIVLGESATGGADIERLRRYFVFRRLADSNRYEGFDQSRLDELRESRRVFSGPAFEDRYRRWQETGDLDSADGLKRHIGFRTQTLPRFYEWLSPRANFRKEGRCP